MRRPVFLSSVLMLIATVFGGWGGSTNPSLKFIRTIGDRNLDEKSQQLQIPTDIVMNKDKQTYVVEAGHHLVTIFDSNGRRVRQFGKPGADPAEFYYPYSLDVDTKGTIYVSDLGNNRIQCFDQDGTYRKELPFPTGNMRVNHSGEISVTRARGDFDYAIEKADLFRSGENVQILTSDGDIRYSLSPKLKYENGQMDVKGNEVYVDFDDLENILIAYAYRPLIEKYDSGGRLVWRKEPRLNFAPSMPGDHKDQTDAFREVQMNRCHAGIAADQQGRIWVVTLRRQLKPEERVATNLRIMRGFDGRKKLTIDVMHYGGPTTVDAFEIEVYGPDGDPLSHIPLAHFADQIRIIGSDLFIVDSYHLQQIYHYEIKD